MVQKSIIFLLELFKLHLIQPNNPSCDVDGGNQAELHMSHVSFLYMVVKKLPISPFTIMHCKSMESLKSSPFLTGLFKSHKIQLNKFRSEVDGRNGV